jgi:DNA-binding protein HU-beta
MNKHALIAKVAQDTGIPKITAAAAVESLLDGIVKTLKKSGSVTFVGFGSFKTVRNSKHRVAQFTPGKALTRSLN